MGHLDAVKAALLVTTLLSWVALARAIVGGDLSGGLGNAGCAIAFLLTASITRLTFTAVETRIQILNFGLTAAALVARDASAANREDQLRR